MTTAPDADATARTRLGPDDWVTAALAAFVDEGPGGIRVEALARTLGATKGSFYWHFKDLAALKAAVLQRLEAEMAEPTPRPAPNPRRKVLNMLLMPELPLMARLRDWGQADPAAAAVVARLDRGWLDEVEATLRANDVDEAQIAPRARVLLAARVGYGRLGGFGQSRDDIEEDLRQLIRLVPMRKA